MSVLECCHPRLSDSVTTWLPRSTRNALDASNDIPASMSRAYELHAQGWMFAASDMDDRFVTRWLFQSDLRPRHRQCLGGISDGISELEDDSPARRPAPAIWTGEGAHRRRLVDLPHHVGRVDEGTSPDHATRATARPRDDMENVAGKASDERMWTACPLLKGLVARAPRWR